MARISTYPVDATITGLDFVIGTDGNNNNETKNYRFSDIKSYIQSGMNVNLVPVLSAQSPVAQNPAGLDTPLQVTFGAAQGTPADPVQLLGTGEIVFNEAGIYLFNGYANFERSGSGGNAHVVFRALINGVQVSPTKMADIDTDDVNIPYELTIPLIVSAGDVLTWEIMRDSSGADDGGLYAYPTTGGWGSVPSADVNVWRIDNSGTGGPACCEYLPKSIWVDSTSGDDATGEVGKPHLPFQTAAAAEAAATSGDTIFFMPGTHVGTNLGKDGVTYHISAGATLSATSGRMFTDSGKGAMTVTVICDGIMSAAAASFCLITQASTFYFDINRAIKNTQTPPNELFQITNGSAVLYVKFDSIVNNSTNPWYVFADSAPGCKYFVEGNYCFTTSNFADIDGEGTFKINRVEATFNNANEIMVNASGNNKVYVEFNYASIVGTNGSIFRANNNGNIIVKNSYITYAIPSPSYAPINAYAGGKIDVYNSTIIYDNTLATRALVGYYAGGNNTNAFFKFYNCQLIHFGQAVGCHGFLLNSGTSPADGNLALSNVQVLLASAAVALGAKAIEDGSAAFSYRAFTDIISNGAWDGTNLVAATSALVDANAKSA